jgi:DnaJ-class molecular chaperone
MPEINIPLELEEECPRCNGSGKHNNYTCVRCGGGRVVPTSFGSEILEFIGKYFDVTRL